MPRKPSIVVPVAGVFAAIALLVLGTLYLVSSLRRNSRLKAETTVTRVQLANLQKRVATSTNAMIDTVLLTFRSVNLRAKGPAENTAIATAIADELKTKTEYFDPDGTRLTGSILGADTDDLTIRFQIRAKLARPMKL